MRVSLRWLQEFVEVDAEPEKLAEMLDLSGTKVEAVHRLGQGIDGVVVAEVLKIDEHPNADNLVLVDARISDSEVFHVVCGARNFAVGDRVPYAQVGAHLPGLEISERKIRGQQSQGMLCSAAELGISKDHSGILVLPPDSPLNDAVTSLLGLDDVIFELEITSNRRDCLSVIGVAREVSAILDTELKVPEVNLLGSSDVASPVSVSIEDGRGCPRYLARYIEGVSVGASPTWMAARLLAAGMRPISNVVDATNYVMLEYGQPLHAFDGDLVTEQSIIVRRAKSGEKLTTLDGLDRELDPEDLVIADPKQAVALAGVIGGGLSEVGDATRNVILEAAHFDAETVAFTARRHQVRTEASARFERGSDPEIVPVAAARAAQLMAETSGGSVSATETDEYPAPIQRASVRLRPERADRVLGAPLSSDTQAKYLRGLGMKVDRVDDAFSVEVPPWRYDVRREEDLIEEVARLSGFGRLPSTLPPGRSGGLETGQSFDRRARLLLTANGVAEAWTTSLMGAWELDQLLVPANHPLRRLVRLANPMSEQEDALRTTLLPGLLRSATRNLSAHRTSVALFEIARIYEPSEEELPWQPVVLAAVFSGLRSPKGWNTAETRWDFFSAKGVLEALIAGAGCGPAVFDTASGMPFHPTRAAKVTLGGARLGSIGELHPDVCANFDVAEGTCVFEIALAPLIDALPGREQAQELMRHPSIYLDLAIVVEDQVPAAEVESLIKATGEPELVSVRAFDLYRGEQVPAGNKSLAFALELRVPDRTLTDEEATAVRDRIVDSLAQRLQATLRT